MLYISYSELLLLISAVWLLLRICIWIRQKRVDWRREAQLLLVYICIIVVVRFTFFPFSKVNGQIQPLVFDGAQMLPPRINVLPFVYLFDYPTVREILINLIGNTTMFLPLGIVWPSVFRALDTPEKTIGAGFGCSLCIEIFQLPFFDRVTDIDDLILNTLGFCTGYGIWFAVKACRRARQAAKNRR